MEKLKNKFHKQWHDPKVSTKEIIKTRKKIEQKEIKGIICKHRETKMYKQQDEEKITWVICIGCGYKERIRHYFGK